MLGKGKEESVSFLKHRLNGRVHLVYCIVKHVCVLGSKHFLCSNVLAWCKLGDQMDQKARGNYSILEYLF